MPRILIRELDATTGGTLPSTNFSVVVPGEIGTTTSTEDVFDENGIYECTSIDDFRKYIGYKACITTGEGKFATLEEIRSDASTEVDKKIATVTAEEFYKTYAGSLYKATELTGAEPTTHRLIAKLATDSEGVYKYYKLDKVTENDKWDDSTSSKNKVGEYKSSQKYAVVESGNEGVNASEIYQMGNQIAYELVRLGYTVLFKKITSSSELATSDFWKPLKDKSIYNFRYVVSGCINSKDSTESIETIYTHIEELVDGRDSTIVANNGRGDCVALLDIPESCYSGDKKVNAVENIKIEAAKSSPNEYCAWFAPVVYYEGLSDPDKVYNNDKLPASFHYLACAAKAMEKYPEWYAVSAYKRGVSNLKIKGVGCKLGEAAIQALQPRFCNVSMNPVNLIITERNSFYLWGNRTAKLMQVNEDLVASNFLNIRQLCNTLKKEIYVTCRSLAFDPNSDILWLNFCNAIRPTLEKMKAQEGIKDYRFEQLVTKHKAKLFAAIRIIPIEAVEDFEIAVKMEDNFDETTISIEEKLN